MNSMLDRSGSTTAAGGADIPDDPRLLEAVQEFLGELEAGRRPQRQDFLRRYPDIAAPLEECLDGLELVHEAAGFEKVQLAGLANPGPALNDMLADPLGDFRIIRELGRGGMGIVYEAMQLSLGRRVALKALPFAATLDAKHLQRFHNEAQAAAQLHHTNIVPVYAVGCERGMHFYAMQLIDGQSLATLVSNLRQNAGRPVDEAPLADSPSGTVTDLSAALSTQRSSRPREFFRTAAILMVQAAEALEHAHQFGIVHRDIKPANLLVDVHGRLWITDFGLAQFHAGTNLTQTGDIVGTLRYMSPEQASGQRVQLDQRTDIYSLGATLYELATLEPIFAGGTRNELLHQIARDEPRPPRAIDRNLPVELETIILKALSKHPGDRYATAQDLAADLQRYLDDKPILATRPTLLERARKWSRRHPALVGAGVLLLVVCIAGLLINNRMISQEQAKTQAALLNEKQRGAEARRAVDLLVEVSEEELADHPQLQSARKRLLETALTYYQNFIETQADAASQAELQSGKNRVRSILNELSTLEGARLLGLVSDKSVQADLKLTPTQRDNLAELGERSSEERLALFREQRSLAPEERRHKFYQLAKGQEAALAGILDLHQLKRLRQIELQIQGARAFHESTAVETLKLTAEQKRRIRDLRLETMVVGNGPPKKDRPAEFAGSTKQHRKRRIVPETLAIAGRSNSSATRKPNWNGY